MAREINNKHDDLIQREVYELWNKVKEYRMEADDLLWHITKLLKLQLNCNTEENTRRNITKLFRDQVELTRKRIRRYKQICNAIHDEGDCLKYMVCIIRKNT